MVPNAPAKALAFAARSSTGQKVPSPTSGFLLMGAEYSALAPGFLLIAGDIEMNLGPDGPKCNCSIRRAATHLRCSATQLSSGLIQTRKLLFGDGTPFLDVLTKDSMAVIALARRKLFQMIDWARCLNSNNNYSITIWNFTAAKLDSKLNFSVEVCRIVFLLQPNIYKNINVANFPEDLTFSCPDDQEPTLESVLNPASVKVGGGEEASLDKQVSTTTDAYRSLTPREEQDVREFLEKQLAMDKHQSETEMTEALQQELASLEGANIHSIVTSETQSRILMNTLDKAIEQAEHLEKEVNAQHDLIVDVKDSMLTLFDRDQFVQVCVDNRERLLSTFSSIISQCNVDTSYEQALRDVNLSSLPNIANCTAAAKKLDALLKIEFGEGVKHMAVLIEFRNHLEHLSKTFSVNLVKWVNNDIIKSIMELKQILSPIFSANASIHSVCQHIDSYKDPRDNLRNLASLVGGWLQSHQKDTLTQVKQSYIEQMQPLLTRLIKELCKATYQDVLDTVKCKKNLSPSASTIDTNASQATLFSISTPETSILMQVYSVFELLLNMVHQILHKEEKIISNFFRLQPSVKTTRLVKGSMVDLDTAKDCMKQLFPSIDQLLTECITNCEQVQHTSILPFFVTVYLKVDDVSRGTGDDSSPFNSFALTWITQMGQTVKQHYQQYIENLIKSFRNEKPSKKSQSGVPRMVRRYTQFINITTVVFEHSNRKSELIWAHKELLRALNREVERVAHESGKTPREVVQLESYHLLKDGIRKIKSEELMEFLKEVSNRSSRALDDYTTNYMGRPLDKLVAFFENIQLLLDRGYRADSIQYQSACSQQALAKVIKEYPKKEIKHGLRELCEKVKKHFSLESNLFLVVWSNIQRKLFNQLNLFNSLIAQCYPNSDCMIAFDIEDLQAIFSEITNSR